MKAILFIRVSTEHQEFEEQTKELKKKAIQDGYSVNNILTIAEKESAIKLSEEERSGIKKMKELIENDSSINCLYVWEVSRLARTKKVLFSVQDYLINKGIQLKVMRPEVVLLNSDGSINTGASMVFTMFAEMAEQEMILKKARFARGKARCNSLGKTNNGRVVFGYTKDEDGYIIVHEQNAKVVRYIFNTYVTTNNSANSIYKELVARGWINRRNRGERTAITNILSNEAYYGGKANRSNHKYPPIITKELFDSAAEKRKNSTKMSKDNTKWFHHAHGLVSYNYNGTWFKMIIRHGRLAYYCEQSKVSISSNVLDSLTWWYARRYELKRNLISDEEEKQNNKRIINTLTDKLEVSKRYIQELKEQQERIDDLFISGRWDRNKHLKKIQELDKILSEEKSKIAYYNAEIERLSVYDEESAINIRFKYPNYKDIHFLERMEDEQAIKNIIQRSVAAIKVIPQSNKHYIIEVEYVKEIPIEEVKFEFWVNGNNLNLIQIRGNERHDSKELIKRIYTRKRYE